MGRPTKLGVGVGGVRVDGVLYGLVVGLDGDLALAGTALVLVVLELAGGDILGTHGCVVVVVCLERIGMLGFKVEMVGMIGMLVWEAKCSSGSI